VPEEICGVDLQSQGNPRLFIGLKWTFNHVLGFGECQIINFDRIAKV